MAPPRAVASCGSATYRAGCPCRQNSRRGCQCLCFGYSDLHVVNVIAVPDWLTRLLAIEHEQILHRFLPGNDQCEISALPQMQVQMLVQQQCRIEVVAEGLFHHDAITKQAAAQAAASSWLTTR